jgi:hypothetical protein
LFSATSTRPVVGIDSAFGIDGRAPATELHAMIFEVAILNVRHGADEAALP